jgi:8-oxo-dGTP pyrophosphatase MutT (NUDIX family)
MSSSINDWSYGVIPLKMQEKTPYIFIIKHRSGGWLLPKGHAEPGETPRQAAERELEEETGLHVERWLDHEPFVEHYSFVLENEKIYKEVQYFPALVTGSIRFQIEEVKDGRWVSVSEAPSCVTFKEMKSITRDVYEWLLNRGLIE